MAAVNIGSECKENVLATEIVLKEGWAVKESGQAFLGKTNWRKRWCRLVKDVSGNITWSYYRKREDTTAAGCVQLDSTYVARELEIGEEKQKRFCFALGPIMDNFATRTYYVSCESEEDKLCWMEVIGASIESEYTSSERFTANRRSVRSRMDRRTKVKRYLRSLSAPAQVLATVDNDFLDPMWRLQQWKTLCSIIKDSVWKKSDIKNGVKLSRLSFKREKYAVIKVEGHIPVPSDHIFEYLLTALRPGGKLDYPFRQENVLQVIEDSIPRASIVSNSYKLPMPNMSTREACLMRCWMPSYIARDGTCGLFVTSVSHPFHELSKGSLRVDMGPSGFVLSPCQQDDGREITLVSVLTQIDLQDSLQSMLETTFKSGLLKIGLRTAFNHISYQLQKYYSLVKI